MSTRIARAVALVKAWHAEHGHWPTLPSPLSESLNLTGEDIETAVEEGLLAVVFLPGSPPRLVAPKGMESYDGLSLPILPEE